MIFENSISSLVPIVHKDFQVEKTVDLCADAE